MYVDTLKWPKNKIIRGIDVCLKVQSRKGSLSTVKLKLYDWYCMCVKAMLWMHSCDVTA